MSIIEVNNVTKEYQLGHLKSLKHSVLTTFGRLRGQEVEKPEPGEVLGIIGSNGAGKSAMLKMLARISTTTRGEVKVRGSVAPFPEQFCYIVSNSYSASYYILSTTRCFYLEVQNVGGQRNL